MHRQHPRPSRPQSSDYRQLKLDTVQELCKTDWSRGIVGSENRDEYEGNDNKKNLAEESICHETNATYHRAQNDATKKGNRTLLKRVAACFSPVRYPVVSGKISLF